MSKPLEDRDAWAPLTVVQREMVEALLAGRTYREIATERRMAPETVRYHLRLAVRRLNLAPDETPGAFRRVLVAYLVRRAA